ncbi:hypothetical protein D9611_001768 [Ephemerocybe angulata]|uniref:Uncharacterized protein n=1 Tax=Ephemerocybe angulata TaxID=980116 RepID=A0A8H5CIT6_9AGAR|nr:hypothetical protein D9611_001768 [Tulosesus angulatus]
MHRGSKAESPERSESAEQLWNILSSLNPRNCTFHIVRTALKHLQLELVPNIVSGEHEHPVYKANGHRALPCVGMLSVIAETCREKPSLNQALIGVLTSDYVDGICMWINFCLHFGRSFPQDMTPGEDFRKAYLIHAQLLCDLLDTSPEATLLFLSSSSFFDLLLRIWMTEGKAGEVFMDLEGRCPILLLMMKVLQNHSEEGPPMLAHRIMARPPFFTTHFAERFVLRAHQASEKATTPVLLGKAVGYLDGLMSATGILLKESHQLIGGFRRVDYLGEYSAVLNALSTQAAEEDRSLLFPGMFRLVTSAFKLVLHQESRAVHNYKELFAGGFIESVLRVILAIPSTDKTTTGLALNYLQILGFYTVYPCVLETMLGVEYPVELRECLERTGSPAIKRAWQDFCVAQHEAGRVLDQMENRRGLCDNSSVGVELTTLLFLLITLSSVNGWEALGRQNAPIALLSCTVLRNVKGRTGTSITEKNAKGRTWYIPVENHPMGCIAIPPEPSMLPFWRMSITRRLQDCLRAIRRTVRAWGSTKLSLL